jgi:hypothetical protein
MYSIFLKLFISFPFYASILLLLPPQRIILTNPAFDVMKGVESHSGITNRDKKKHFRSILNGCLTLYQMYKRGKGEKERES